MMLTDEVIQWVVMNSADVNTLRFGCLRMEVSDGVLVHTATESRQRRGKEFMPTGLPSGVLRDIMAQPLTINRT